AHKSHDTVAIAQLSREVAQYHGELLAQVALQLDEKKDYAGAAEAVRSLSFVEKIQAQIERAAADRDEAAAAQR
ncbi:MAG TPA: iron-sulfur cluster co-chaperone HscB C-terminal domain-containing protein, partial [Burkholderiaceae bacterium]|nr:iron-sulfur cluster co-chaperone HscB C-terminal domain-containing protein [Burkholderiaceae bacterium]